MTSISRPCAAGWFTCLSIWTSSLHAVTASMHQRDFQDAPPAFDEDLVNPLASPKASFPKGLLRAETRGELSIHKLSDPRGEDGKVHAILDKAGNVDSLELVEMDGVSQQTPFGDVDCVWEDWRDWSVCQFTCGGGESIRTRKVEIMAQGNGSACDDNVRESRNCAKNDCPVDCKWDDWSDWSTCSTSCGIGTKVKIRGFKQVAAFGGLQCPGTTTQSSECTLGDCPIDCKYDDWRAWGGCSVSCGDGVRKRYRPVAVLPNAVGKQCEAVGKNVEEAECGQNNCPVDCELEDWTNWDLCNVSCGEGVTQRTRAIKGNGAAFGGQPCGAMSQSKTCDNGLCPADCKLSDWSDWHACDVSCGGGKRKRSRNVADAGNIFGAKCPTDEASRNELESCSMNSCPVDCRMSDWMDWTDCSVTCSAGIIERYRENQVHAEYGGRACIHNTTYEKKACSQNPCPVDCEWDDWQEWRGCSTTCGDGTSVRMRPAKTPELYGGKACGNGFSQNRSCNLRYCPVHCQWNDWEDWSSCSNSCGEGSQGRLRQIAVQADYGGLPCAGNTQQSRTCTDGPCPIHCAWRDWDNWSSCSASCDKGVHSRSRLIGTEPMHGGEACSGNAAETKECENLAACPVDCEWDDWTEWQACTKTCGEEGVSKRSRIRKHYEKNGGHICYGTEDDEQRCTLDPCPIPCVLGDWSQWDACSMTCGVDGVHTRTRGIKTPAKYGGDACPDARTGEKPCELGACPVDCVWTDWQPWAECSKSCNGGATSRLRTEKTAMKNNGKPCQGASREDVSCNVEGCPVDCKWESWSEWGSCDVSCGGGVRKQTRRVKIQPQWNGTECETTNGRGGPADVKTESCSEQNCPVDCCWSSWTAFSLCSKSCESGMMSRTRVKQPPESDGGLPCIGTSNETNFCNTQGCPRDCQWGQWSTWTECSRHCGGGKIKRFRDIVTQRKNGGEKCVGLFEQEAECNVAPCPVPCLWGEWSEWRDCPVSCDSGSRLRTRAAKQQAEHGGQLCEGNTTEKVSCSSQPCPVDCSFKQWGDWSPCSSSCGGDRIRQRVKEKEMFGGKACEGEMLERGPCDSSGAHGCPATTSTTTTTTTTTKPIKPCNRSSPDNQTAQIDAVIRKIESDQTPSTINETSSASLSDADKLIGTLAGDMSLEVDDVDSFVENSDAPQALKMVIADRANVRPDLLSVFLTPIEARSIANKRRRTAGNVNAEYRIEWTAQSGRSATDVASSISQADMSQVSALVQQWLKTYGVSVSARAESLSVTVLTEGQTKDTHSIASLTDQEKPYEKPLKEGGGENDRQHWKPIRHNSDQSSKHEEEKPLRKHEELFEEEITHLREARDQEHETKSGKIDEEKLASEVEKLIQALKVEKEVSAVKAHDQSSVGLVESRGSMQEPKPVSKNAANLAALSLMATAAASAAFVA